MTATKISALTALPAAADADLIPIVDVSDTAQGAGGSTRKITKGQLVGSYVFQVGGAQFSPADATTYYLGHYNGATIETTAQRSRIYIPHAGVVKRIDVHISRTGTNGSGETSTVSFRLNNTTDTTISAAVTVNNASGFNIFSNTALAIAVAAGDYFEIKWVTPTWATNPTNCRFMATVYVEPM